MGACCCCCGGSKRKTGPEEKKQFYQPECEMEEKREMRYTRQESITIPPIEKPTELVTLGQLARVDGNSKKSKKSKNEKSVEGSISRLSNDGQRSQIDSLNQQRPTEQIQEDKAVDQQLEKQKERYKEVLKNYPDYELVGRVGDGSFGEIIEMKSKTKEGETIKIYA